MHELGALSWSGAACIVLTLGLSGARAQGLAQELVCNIGSRLELFVDEYLIESMSGVTRELHAPERKGPVMILDRPWEGAFCYYFTLFQDGDIYRMYYRGNPVNPRATYADFPNYAGAEVTCYAESRDGIHWRRPNLNLFQGDFATDRYGNPFTLPASNNIVWVGQGPLLHSTHNFSPFKDANPACRPEARYKAVARTFEWKGYENGMAGLLGFQSPDAIHWSLVQEDPIIISPGLDGHNVVFWDAYRGRYVEFERGGFRNGYRDMATRTSPDFIHWTPGPMELQWFDWGVPPDQHVYTSPTLAYFRAPHIFLGFANRLVGGRVWVEEHPEHEISDAIFMSSRDGLHFDRSFMEGWIRPGLDPNKESWIHGNTSPAWGILQTGPEELSVYWVDHYQLAYISQLQRGTLRLDGFVSMHAKYGGGEFTTKPLSFTGRELVMNFSTSAVGSVRVEIQDQAANPIPGFTLADCPEIYGDAIEQAVKWAGGSDVSALAGQVVRLRFVMKDADLYAIRFRP